MNPNVGRLHTIAVQLLAHAAEAWAANAVPAAERLTAAAWEVVGNDKFVDQEEAER
jgi:hypothetical protein